METAGPALRVFKFRFNDYCVPKATLNCPTGLSQRKIDTVRFAFELGFLFVGQGLGLGDH